MTWNPKPSATEPRVMAAMAGAHVRRTGTRIVAPSVPCLVVALRPRWMCMQVLWTTESALPPSAANTFKDDIMDKTFSDITSTSSNGALCAKTRQHVGGMAASTQAPNDKENESGREGERRREGGKEKKGKEGGDTGWDTV
eukprot:scaffold55961_cov29-Tisochrysis_lutea.AAC.4